MSEYLWFAIAILVIAAFATAFAAVGGFFQRLFQTQFLLLFAIGLVGCISGFWTTNSRDTALADVVPAVLTLFAGLGMVAVARSPTQERNVAMMVICLAVSFGGAALWGASNRELHEQYDANQIRNELKQRSLVEKDVNGIRSALGLKPLDSSYFFGSERPKEKEK